MLIKQARFMTSLSAFKPFEGQGMPEIAMAGKSNVGKSSLINSLTRNSKLARTSSEPGKTRLVNLYKINESMILTDLPGYGFAKAPQEEKKKWAGMIEGYLSKSKHLVHVLQLVDIRHAPTADDKMMVDYLRHYGLDFTVVATKADKLSRAERSRAIPLICRTLEVQPWEVIAYSSENGQGREEILELFDKVLAPEEQEIPEWAENMPDEEEEDVEE